MPHLGEPEVRALAGMRGNDVVDDHSVVRRGHAADRDELLLRAERRVGVEADAVEISIDRRRIASAPDAAAQLGRAGMERPIPIEESTCHSRASPSVLSTNSPGGVMIEAG